MINLCMLRLIMFCPWFSPLTRITKAWTSILTLTFFHSAQYHIFVQTYLRFNGTIINSTGHIWLTTTKIHGPNCRTSLKCSITSFTHIIICTFWFFRHLFRYDKFRLWLNLVNSMFISRICWIFWWSGRYIGYTTGCAETGLCLWIWMWLFIRRTVLYIYFWHFVAMHAGVNNVYKSDKLYI